jgi:hypothetical protein
MDSSVWDESEAEEQVTCLECGAPVDVDCPHLLLVADVTYGASTGGVADEFWDRYTQQVQEVFAKCLREKTSPQWSQYAVQKVWDDMDLEESDDPEKPSLPVGAFINLVVEVLQASGGTEHPGSLVGRSGAYSESVMRIMYDADPRAVCERAVQTLAEWLIPKKPRRRSG